jgi:hypothetical protein
MSLNIIKLLNRNWYLSNEVHIIDPAFFPGCHINMRLIIEKKNLKPNNYMFAYIKNNVWIESTDKYARSKLLLSSDWVENNVPKIIVMMKKKSLTNNNIIESELNDEYNDINELYDVVPAPPVLKLYDNEKFKDNNGKILEIKTVGEKFEDKIYFLAKDIAIVFNISTLERNIMDKRLNYIINEDYKFFTIDNKYKIKKELYLTFNGFIRVINKSTKNFSFNTINSVNTWLNYIINIKNRTFILNTNSETLKSGIVYCITSELVNYIKIGYWRKSINSLKRRYITYLGNNLNLFYVNSLNPPKLEKECHNYFNHFKISNELFDKKYLNEYRIFLENNK